MSSGSIAIPLAIYKVVISKSTLSFLLLFSSKYYHNVLAKWANSLF